ncbi:MAG: Gfo/Idh/MocA family oxidoreductase [Ktedonobacteraceae bacterium]
MSCNWGILGPGFIATRAIIPALLQVPHATVRAVASRDAQRAATTASQFGIERAYAGYQALLDDPDIDIVYIALPNSLHAEWTIRAAQAGKHVLCEKPLAISVAECDQMIAACHRASVLLMEAVMYRFHPRMLALQQLLTAGELGTLHFLHTAFSFPFQTPDNYRAHKEYGGGALLDVGSYCINAIRWLTNLEPRSVHAQSSYSQEIDISTSAILGFEQNILAHMQCSFAAAEHQVVEVVGSTAAVSVPLAFTAWKDDGTSLLLQRGAEFERRAFAPADPYQLMVAHFTDCVREQTALLYPATDGRATLRVLEMLRVEQGS